jgi:hypothetical protein
LHEGYFKIKDGSPGKCYKLIGQRNNTLDSDPLTSDGFYVDKDFFVKRDVAIGLCNAESAKLPGASSRDTIIALENLLNEYSEKPGLMRQFAGKSLNGDPANGIWLRYERLAYDFNQEELPGGLNWNNVKNLDDSSHWVEIHNLRTNRSNFYDLYEPAVKIDNTLFRPFREVVNGVAVFKKKNGPPPPDDQPRDDSWPNGRNELATAIKSIGRENPYGFISGEFDYGVDDFDPSARHAVLCEKAVVSRVIPVGGAHKDLWTAGWGYDKLYDGTESTSVWDYGCYHSQGTTGSWVEVYLDEVYTITEVNVLNRGDCCADRAIGMVVKVCNGQGDGNCRVCGTVATGDSGAWLKVKCAAGSAGDNVRFEHDNYIQICEVNIQGYPGPYP